MPSSPGHSLLMDLLGMSIFKDQRCVETAKVCAYGNVILAARVVTISGTFKAKLKIWPSGNVHVCLRDICVVFSNEVPESL